MECVELRDKAISEIPSLEKNDADAVTLLIEEWKTLVLKVKNYFAKGLFMKSPMSVSMRLAMTKILLVFCILFKQGK